MHEKMKQFLKDDMSNQWVLYDLEQPFFIAGCTALALDCKLVTTHFLTLVERKQQTLDINLNYMEMTNFLKDAAQNIEDFMSGKLKSFPDIYIKNDCWFEDPIPPLQYDCDCATLLSIMLPALCKLAEERFKDQLPEGYFQISSYKSY